MADNDAQLYRELGSMDARIGNIESSVDEVKTDLRDMKKSVDTVLAQTADLIELKTSVKTLLERSALERGGRNTLWKVGTASGTGGALLVGIAQWLSSVLHVNL